MSLLRRYHKLIKQIMLFGIVGVVTLGIDVAVTAAAYYMFSMEAYVASALGFLSGFFFNFPVNRKKVFNHSILDRFSAHQQIIMYVFLAIFNLLVTSFCVEFLVSFDILKIERAKIAVTIMIAIWNFAIFKFLIFSKRKK